MDEFTHNVLAGLAGRHSLLYNGDYDDLEMAICNLIDEASLRNEVGDVIGAVVHLLKACFVAKANAMATNDIERVFFDRPSNMKYLLKDGNGSDSVGIGARFFAAKLLASDDVETALHDLRVSLVLYVDFVEKIAQAHGMIHILLTALRDAGALNEDNFSELLEDVVSAHKAINAVRSDSDSDKAEHIGESVDKAMQLDRIAGFVLALADVRIAVNTGEAPVEYLERIDAALSGNELSASLQPMFNMDDLLRGKLGEDGLS